MRKCVLIVALLTASTALFAQASSWPPSADHPTMPLWPNGAPEGQPAPGPEADMTVATDNRPGGKPVIRIGNVSNPTLTLYAAKGKNTGAAVVVFPGGGYRILAIDLEGTEVCDWLNAAGINCILVKYRVPQPGPYPKSAAPLQDAQRALGMVRSHAAEWHIDPQRVGVLGFSAGAHLAAALSTHFDHRLYPTSDAADQLSCRPDFAVIVYPGYLALADQNFAPNADIHPNDRTPPTFLLQAEDDTVHVENAVVYFLALKNAKVPAELHIYAEGGHGYGLRRTALPVTTWPQTVEVWLHTIHVLSDSPTAVGQPAPAAIDAPSGTEVVLTLTGEGAQVYTCSEGHWKLKGPDAKLLDAHGQVMGTHFAGPTWRLQDGSEVKGKAIANQPSPDASSVPWLLVQAAGGSGTLAKVAYIRRTETHGGLPPGTPCDTADTGEKRVPYSATYSFYKVK